MGMYSTHCGYVLEQLTVGMYPTHCGYVLEQLNVGMYPTHGLNAIQNFFYTDVVRKTEEKKGKKTRDFRERQRYRKNTDIIKHITT